MPFDHVQHSVRVAQEPGQGEFLASFGFWCNPLAIETPLDVRRAFGGHFLKHVFNPDEPWERFLRANTHPWFPALVEMLCGQFKQNLGNEFIGRVRARYAGQNERDFHVRLRQVIGPLAQNGPRHFVMQQHLYLSPEYELAEIAKVWRHFCQKPPWYGVDNVTLAVDDGFVNPRIAPLMVNGTVNGHDLWARAYDLFVQGLSGALGWSSERPLYQVGEAHGDEDHFYFFLTALGFLIVARQMGHHQYKITSVYYRNPLLDWRDLTHIQASELRYLLFRRAYEQECRCGDRRGRTFISEPNWRYGPGQIWTDPVALPN